MQQSQLGEYSGELLRVQIGNNTSFTKKKHSFPHYVRMYMYHLWRENGGLHMQPWKWADHCALREYEFRRETLTGFFHLIPQTQTVFSYRP